MTERELVCISCPLGCNLKVSRGDDDSITVTGNTCPKGKIYAENETVNPMRTVTSIASVDGGEIPMVSVKTSESVPKARIFEVIKQIENLRLTAPVKAGDILIKNILDLHSDIIATKTVCKRREG